MSFPVTSQKAPTLESAEILKEKPSLGVRLDNGKIEVYEMAVVRGIALGIADAVGIVACRARCFDIDYMFLMLFETLIIQDAVPVMAFVTEGIGGRALLRVITRIVSLRKKVLIGGTMRASWSAGIVGIMAVCTRNHTLRRIGKQQARDIGIDPRGSDRVERRICRIELHAGVELIDLAGDGELGYYVVVPVTFETDFVPVDGVLYGLARQGDASDAFVRSGHPSRPRGRGGVHTMWIMAVHALDVLGNIGHCEILRGIMDTCVILDPMGMGLCQLCLDIGGRDIPIVADQAVILLEGIVEKPLRPTRRMGPVAILTSVLRHGLIIRVGPWIGTLAIPRGIGQGMRASGPALLLVTGGAETSIDIGHNQELPIGIVVGVVAGRALELAAVVEPDLGG